MTPNTPYKGGLIGYKSVAQKVWADTAKYYADRTNGELRDAIRGKVYGVSAAKILRGALGRGEYIILNTENNEIYVVETLEVGLGLGTLSVGLSKQQIILKGSSVEDLKQITSSWGGGVGFGININFEVLPNETPPHDKEDSNNPGIRYGIDSEFKMKFSAEMHASIDSTIILTVNKLNPKDYPNLSWEDVKNLENMS